MCFVCRKGCPNRLTIVGLIGLRDGIPESLVAEEAARQQAESNPAIVLAGFSQSIADRTPIAQRRRGATAFGYRPSRLGGSHPRCGRVPSLEGTELMNYFTDARDLPLH